MKNVINSLAESVLLQIGSTAAALPIDVVIHEKVPWLGMTTLLISNEEINNIKIIVKLVKESSLLIMSISKAIKDEAKEQNDGSISNFLVTSGARLLENVSTG